MFDCGVMKPSFVVIILGSLLVLSSCETMKSINLNRPIDTNTGYDPLDPAGSRRQVNSSTVDTASARYKPGQWVETSMDNSAFFRQIPKGNAQADKVLKAATPLKVIATQGTYVKVQLESGAIGYVPEIMVAEKAASMTSDFPPVAPIDPSALDAPVPDMVIPEGDAPSFSLPDAPPSTTTPGPGRCAGYPGGWNRSRAGDPKSGRNR